MPPARVGQTWIAGAAVLVLVFSAWTLYVLWRVDETRREAAVRQATATTLEQLLAALDELSQASAAISRSAAADIDAERWRTLYGQYRDKVRLLEDSGLALQDLSETLMRGYSHATRSERIRQALLGEKLPPEESRVLEAEFRAEITAAQAEFRGAMTKLEGGPAPDSLARLRHRFNLYAATAMGLIVLIALLLVLQFRSSAVVRELVEVLQRADAVTHAFEHVPAPVAVLDKDGRFLWANAAFRRESRLSPEELAGAMAREKLGPLWSRFKMVEPRAEAGSPACFVLTAPDPAAIDEARRESAMWVAGGLAQNLSSLMTRVNGYAALVAETAGPDSPLAPDIAEIMDASDRAMMLSSQLLLFAGKRIRQSATRELNDLIRAAGLEIRAAAGSGVRVVEDLSPATGAVHVDERELRQALVNLAYNARDAMPDGGCLTVRTAKMVTASGPAAMVELSDTGCGMDNGTRQRLFEPFFTTKPEGKGAGLGLAAVYGITHAAGGRIDVRSEKGKGTTVRILLPRVQPGGPCPPPALGQA